MWDKGEKIMTCDFKFHDSSLLPTTVIYDKQSIFLPLYQDAFKNFPQAKVRKNANTILSWKFRKHFCIMENSEE